MLRTIAVSLAVLSSVTAMPPPSQTMQQPPMQTPPMQKPPMQPPANPSCPGSQGSTMGATGKAIYFITNDAENAVVAVPIGKDGMLSKGTVTKTGGMGSNAIEAKNGQKAMPDALISQSALTIAGGNIFAVNAGSNTLTMLSISPSNPTMLKVVGQPMRIPGDFPNTVAASEKHKLVCVGTTGKMAGISCANYAMQGMTAFDALRPYNLNQTTPPMGPLNTVSHTFFSADGNMLLTTVKGDPTKNNTGFLSSFKVEMGRGAACLSKTDVRSSPKGTAVLFGSATIPGSSNIFVTDASFGAAVLSLDAQGKASLVRNQTITGQKATCWAAISGHTKSAFVTDVAVNRVVEMSIQDARILGQVDLSANGDGGLIDLRAAGNFVYGLAFGNGTHKPAVTVLDVSRGQGSLKQLQHFTLDGMATGNAQGMAVLM